MNVTLRQLQAFVAVSQTGSFTLAAERLFITQSALSGLIKELEASLGLRLFDRSTRRLRLSVLGASGYKDEGLEQIIASRDTYDLIVERGQQDMDSEIGRFPRLFQAVESVPGLTWPTITFEGEMALWLGKLEVRIKQVGRGHTKGDTIVYLPSQNICFSGDLVEADAACYTGDAYLADWPQTLDNLAAMKFDKLVPGRGPALLTPEAVQKGLAYTRDFVSTLYTSAQEAVAQGMDLNACMKHTRKAMDPKFGHVFIYEHCLPFDVTRAHDEASGIRDPRIWTAQRDQEMWHALQQG